MLISRSNETQFFSLSCDQMKLGAPIFYSFRQWRRIRSRLKFSIVFIFIFFKAAVKNDVISCFFFLCYLYNSDNPVLCDAGLADLTVALEVNHAKVYGVANDCPTKTSPELTSLRPPLSQTLFLAAAAVAAGGNVSFAATLE